jgi:PAS domain S-box-containing protein
MPHRIKHPKTNSLLHPKAINLYKFIRLILGTQIPDSHIARLWHMDTKNFYNLKNGRYPIPGLPRLKQLALILKIDKYWVFEVADGNPARYVFSLLKQPNLKSQLRLLGGQLNKAYTRQTQAEKRYHLLFTQANDAIFVLDPQTGTFVDCNQQAERLTGYARKDIIGMHHADFITPDRRQLYTHPTKNPIRKFAAAQDHQIKTHRVLRADGSTLPLSISRNTIEIDGKTMLLAICRPIA